MRLRLDERETMRTLLTAIVLAILSILPAQAQEGLVIRDSDYGVAETADRLVSILEENDVTVMARVDHAANAERVGLELPPTVLVIFGNPRIGTPLMQAERTVGIDLPQKALVWQEDDGTVRLAYNTAEHLADRHGITGRDEALQRLAGALNRFTAHAVGASD